MRKIFLVTLVQAFTWTILFSACDNKGGGSGEAYSIKMRLKEGDRFGQDMNMKMNMQAAIINMNMTMETGTDFEVMKASPDENELKLTYTKMHMGMEAGGLPNVKGQSDSALNEKTGKIVGKSVTIKMDKNNKITSVVGLKEILDSMAADETQKQVFEKMFSADQFNNSMGWMFSMYPNKPVKVGETWSASTKMNMAGMDMNIDIDYKLLSVKDGVATINVDGTIKGEGSMKAGAQDMKMNMSGDQKGKLNIKLDDGYLKDGDYKMNLKAEMEVMGTKVPMDMKADCTIKGR